MKGVRLTPMPRACEDRTRYRAEQEGKRGSECTQFWEQDQREAHESDQGPEDVSSEVTVRNF